MSKLVVINKTLAVMSHELGEKWITIGRHEGNAFQIPELSVSGRHCEVRLRDDELSVRDLQSTNGTFVDGKIFSEGAVKPGQILRVGDVELNFEISAEAAETSATPFTSKMLLTKAADGATKITLPTTPMTEAKPASLAKKFQVLFVDDSMAFLETFTELCADLSGQSWQIQTAASADRALVILQQGPVDLVVLDIGIPMVDGIQLLGIISRRYPGIKIIVMTGNADENNRATCLAGGAELFVEKPVTLEGFKMVFNMLNDLVSWTHREGFSGMVRQVGLQEVIQMECLGRHSSILEIRNEQTLGQIYIEAGAVTHAAVGNLTGEKAFNKLLSLKGGGFHLKPFQAPPQRTVRSSWEVLVMEAARCSDEDTVFIPKNSSEEEFQLATPNLPSPKATMDDDFVVVATYDGQWKPADDVEK